MKTEMEIAMKLLEKDTHEKQDTLVALRQQLEEVKAINLQMFHKVQVGIGFVSTSQPGSLLPSTTVKLVTDSRSVLSQSAFQSSVIPPAERETRHIFEVLVCGRPDPRPYTMLLHLFYLSLPAVPEKVYKMGKM